jgi:hypothetical protein
MSNVVAVLKSFAACTALCTAAGVGAQTNLLVNGSFESGAFVNQGSVTMSLAAGSTVISGWTVVTDTTAWIGAGNPWGLTASDGSFFLDLTNYQSGAPFAGLSQTIATTPGATYSLTFELGSSSFWGRPSAIVANAGGTSATFSSGTTGGNNDWSQETMQFVATSASTVVVLQGSAGANYIGLDNASVEFVSGPGTPPPVTAIPEPGTWALMLAGMASLAASARRRRVR